MFRLLLFGWATSFVTKADTKLISKSFAHAHDAADCGINDATNWLCSLLEALASVLPNR